MAAPAYGPLATALRAVPCVALLVAGVLAGCCCPPPAVAEQKDYARPLPPGVYPLEHVHDLSQGPDLALAYNRGGDLLAALGESRAYFDKPSSHSHFPYRTPDRDITHEAQVRTLEELEDALRESDSPAQFAARIHERFDIYRSVGWDGRSGEVLFTGYYTPVIEGRLAPDPRFRFPLHRRPEDLVTDEDGTPRGRRLPDGRVVPYYTRAEIEAGKLLAGRELVWLEDRFDAFIVHVQGSARIRLEDGRELEVGYAGKTDRPYRSIGRELVRRGRVPASEMSLARLRRYFREHPEELDSVLALNESYVFFTESQAGPFGSIGARVTAYHSIATDKSVFPRGGPVVVDTTLPVAAGDPLEPAHMRHVGIFLDQDTGGAIRSAGRADLYLGAGDSAEALAGTTRSEGRLYYLFLKAEHLDAGALGTEPASWSTREE